MMIWLTFCGFSAAFSLRRGWRHRVDPVAVSSANTVIKVFDARKGIPRRLASGRGRTAQSPWNASAGKGFASSSNGSTTTQPRGKAATWPHRQQGAVTPARRPVVGVGA